VRLVKCRHPSQIRRVINQGFSKDILIIGSNYSSLAYFSVCLSPSLSGKAQGDKEGMGEELLKVYSKAIQFADLLQEGTS
jgi:hypothetical protein